MLIDAQKLVRRLSAVCLTDDCFGMGIQMGINHAMKIIGEAPFADAVEVVRCKDCKKREICRTTNIWAVAPGDEWFCADGERRTDD